MGQKINPVSLRLQYTNRNFDNCWYSNYFYKNLITRDILLQYYFNNFLKLLKLDSGRYSIQHLQKNTQIYNFLCYSKSTREWRSKIFGLAKRKNFSKKNRFFFKTSTRLKKKSRKYVKLKYFYNHLNQIAVHRIKKKITSFQNLLLWSTLMKTKPLFKDSLSSSFLSFCSDKKKPNNSLISSKIGAKTQFNNFFLFPVENLIKSTVTKDSFFTNLNPDSSFLNEKTGAKSLLVKKMNPLTLSKKKLPKELKANTPSFSPLILEKPISNSNLLFLHNLVIYKILKSKLNSNTNLFFTKKKRNQNEGNQINKFFNQSNISFFDKKGGLQYKYTNHLELSLASLYKTEMNLIHFKVKNDWQNASYLADEIVYFLEKRISFRALKSKILKQLAKIPQIHGIRITCSGRVGGKSKKAQRAKTECIKYGQTSLQVFSSKIDFSVKTAFTSFGSVGVKVWICYN